MWIKASLADLEADCRGETLDTPELLTPGALFIQLQHCQCVGVLHFQTVSVTRSGRRADRRWRKWYWHYQASVRRCVKCAHCPSDRDVFTWIYHLVLHHMPFSVCTHPFPTFAKQPKNMLFPVAISFYLGTFAKTGMLACQTWVPLFCPCVGHCIQALCCVTAG